MNAENSDQTEITYLDGIYVATSTSSIALAHPSYEAGSGLESEDELVGGLAKRLESSLPKLEETIDQFCKLLRNSLKSLNADEVSAEFGIAIHAGSALPFVTGGGEALVKVQAKWSKSSIQ